MQERLFYWSLMDSNDCEMCSKIEGHPTSNPPPPKSAAEFGRPRRCVGFLNFADLFCRFFGFL